MKIWLSKYLKNHDIEKKILKNHEVIEGKSNNLDGVDGVIIWHERFPQDFVNQKDLKYISRFGAGIDNINFEFCRKNSIRVSNVPDYGIDEVSDTAISFLTWWSRSIGFYTNYVTNHFDGSWEENIAPFCKRASETTVGVIGFGKIGMAFARKAKSIGFKITTFDPLQRQGYEKILGVKAQSSLEELLIDSDIISFHCDLNNHTKHMINTETLNLCKKNAFIINTARGDIVENEDQILDYIECGKIGGFAADVLPNEPPRIEFLERIKSSKLLEGRVLITPHTAFYSEQSFEEMRRKAAKNMLDMITHNYPTKIEKEVLNIVEQGGLH